MLSGICGGFSLCTEVVLLSDPAIRTSVLTVSEMHPSNIVKVAMR